MLAYPTPTFDGKTILAAPGYRPLGKAGMTVPSDEPVAETPLNKVNRHTTNGGYVGTRARNFIQNNQFLNEKYDPVKGTPLSKPGAVGNVGDQFIAAGRPFMAEPVNEELKAIMGILNGKPVAPEAMGRLSARQVRSLGRQSAMKKPKDLRKDGTTAVIKDWTEVHETMKKERQIKSAMALGFSRQEANEAYKKVREKEAERALMRGQDPSVQLYDVIDSKIGGNVNGSRPGNDESALYLAKGENVVETKKAVKKKAAVDEAIAKARG